MKRYSEYIAWAAVVILMLIMLFVRGACGLTLDADDLDSIRAIIRAEVRSALSDSLPVGDLTALFDGTGAPLWVEYLRVGNYWAADTADTAVKVVGKNTGTHVQGDEFGIEAISDRYGIYGYGREYGMYCYGQTSGIRAMGVTAGAIFVGDMIGYGIIADSCRIGGDITVDRVDSLGTVALTSIDSLLDLVCEGDTNLYDFDSAFAATPAGVWGYASRTITGGVIDTAAYLSGSINVVSPYAYATNRVRIENQNTPIKWAQAEQDTIKWDIDTALVLSTFDSVNVYFRAWTSRTDTTTIIYNECIVDTANSTAALYIEESETQTLTSGNYPADLWLDRYSGATVLKTQIWNKTIQIDRSSRGSR